MRNYLYIYFFFQLFLFQFGQAQPYAIGADLSYLKQDEDNNVIYIDNGKKKDCLQIFHEHGYNWIRLRLFHTPTELPNTLEYTISIAKKAKKMGYKFLLDFHYSDTWADPSNQSPPLAWKDMNHSDLTNAVYEYTKKSLMQLYAAEVYPDMVQIGNEIGGGMLWPDGKLPHNWKNFTDLLQAGINGVRASCNDSQSPQIMIHIENGADKKYSKYFFDSIFAYKINFDVIGFSYYPWWQGSLINLRENLHFIANEYKKDIILVETAYNYYPTEYKNRSAPFEESQQGQKEFLETVNTIIMNIPNSKGIGIFWWEPASSQGYRVFFDKRHKSLPIIKVFDKFTRN